MRRSSTSRTGASVLATLSVVVAVIGATTPVSGAEKNALSPAAIDSLTRWIATEVETIRGHEFEQDVPVRVVDDATLRAYVLERLDETFAPDRMRDDVDAYVDLGLVDPELDVLAILLDALEAQVAGFYDPVEKVVFLLDDQPPVTAPVILAHELTHALDDQHFDLERALLDTIEENDRAVAASGAREGSGMAVMTVFLTQQTMNGRLDARALGEALGRESAGEVPRDLPPVLARAMLAPYALGTPFVLRGDRRRTWSGNLPADLDRVLSDPPRSTEQLLHPEKYWREGAFDPPLDVELPPLADVLGPAWTLAASGTLGELDVACLTGDCVASMSEPSRWTDPAATGWGGDRWELWRHGEATLTAWVLVGDRPDDAAEFVQNARLPRGSLCGRDGAVVVVVAGEPGASGDPRLAARVLDAVLAGVRISDDTPR